MTIAEMLNQSGLITILGMGVVFSFILIMVICVTAMGKVFQAIESAKKTGSTGTPATSKPVATEAGKIAAIAAALHEYRKS